MIIEHLTVPGSSKTYCGRVARPYTGPGQLCAACCTHHAQQQEERQVPSTAGPCTRYRELLARCAAHLRQGQPYAYQRIALYQDVIQCLTDRPPSTVHQEPNDTGLWCSLSTGITYVVERRGLVLMLDDEGQSLAAYVIPGPWYKITEPNPQHQPPTPRPDT